MSQQNIDFGAFPDDPNADAIRTAFDKVQQNFNELYSTTIIGSVATVNGGAGITVNSPTGNVVVTSSISNVTLNTNTLRMGVTPANTSLTASITQTSSQQITIDIDPANVFSANFSGVSGALANITGTLTSNSNSQPNITSVGTLANLTVTGNVAAANFVGNLVGNVTSAITAGTVTTNAQPNITSVGNLTSLAVVGNITSGNVNVTGNMSAVNFIGNLVGNISGNLVVPGSNTEVIFNNNGSANASNAFTFNQSSNVMTVNGNMIAGNVFANSGEIRATTFTGTLATNAQPNITSVGTLTGLTVNGLSNFGLVSNVTITGGNANAFLMTNGSGTLTWNNGTLLPVQGNNSEVIFNDGGTTYAGNANLTFNKTTGALTTTLLGGTLTTNSQPNITSVGTLANLNVTGPSILNGNLNTANTSVTGILSVTANVTSPQFISNVTTGTAPFVVTSTTQVANLNVATANLATFATTANSVAGANVSGTVSSATVAASANAVAGANVSGTVSSATTAGTVTTNAQPNITSVGTLTSLTSSGNIQGANLISTGYNFKSVGTGITAAGSSQGAGTALTAEMNIVSTVSSGANGVVLPTAIVGMTVTITNTTANSLLVYPASGGTINSLGTNTAFAQGTTTIQFIAPTTTQWYTVGATYA